MANGKVGEARDLGLLARSPTGLRCHPDGATSSTPGWPACGRRPQRSMSLPRAQRLLPPVAGDKALQDASHFQSGTIPDLPLRNLVRGVSTWPHRPQHAVIRVRLQRWNHWQRNLSGLRAQGAGRRGGREREERPLQRNGSSCGEQCERMTSPVAQAQANREWGGRREHSRQRSRRARPAAAAAAAAGGGCGAG